GDEMYGVVPADATERVVQAAVGELEDRFGPAAMPVTRHEPRRRQPLGQDRMIDDRRWRVAHVPPGLVEAIAEVCFLMLELNVPAEADARREPASSNRRALPERDVCAVRILVTGAVLQTARLVPKIEGA